MSSPAAATDGAVVSDVVTFAGRATLVPLPIGGGSPFVITSDSCQVASDGEAPVPCSLVATGTLLPDGTGTAVGVVASSDGVIFLNESFQPTGPNTGVGTGTGTEADDSGANPITFTAAFRTAPTNAPNVLLDEGTIVVREQPTPQDPD
jgi:type 1 fimbria pilin